MKKYLFLLFLLLLNIINTCNGIELIIEIDFWSNLEYTNYECGGSIQIDLNVNKQNDTISYPPCKSFNDAGIRSRQFYNGIINGFRYIDISLILMVINYNPNYPTTGKGVVFGTLGLYCGLEIRVKDQVDTIITIDGTQAGDSFITWNGKDITDNTCKSGKQILNLYNINFINWYMIVLRLTGVNSTIYNNTPMTFNFNKLSTYSTNTLLYSDGYFDNSKINIQFNNCTFSNIQNQNTFNALIFSSHNLKVNNCVFENTNSKYPLILVEHGGSSLNDCRFFNCKISTNAPLIYTNGHNTMLNNIKIEECRVSIISTQSMQMQYLSENKISNIELKNNVFYYSLISTTFFMSTGLFNFNFRTIPDYPSRSFKMVFDNITFNSNQLENDKNFFTANQMNYIGFKNVDLPTGISSTVLASNTIIEIDGNSSFNSNSFCIGSNNSISINKHFEKKLDDYLKGNCTICNVNYLLKDNIANSDYTIGGNNGNSSNGGNNKSIDSGNVGNGFNKLYLIPIILIPILVSSIIICIFFRKRINSSSSKNNIEINNNNDYDYEDHIVEGEIIMDNLASTDNDVGAPQQPPPRQQ